jgi:lysophospholipase L1-like esterase
MAIRRVDSIEEQHYLRPSFMGGQRVFSTDAYPTGTSGVTIVNQVPAFGSFSGLKLVYANQNTTASTITTAKVATTATDGDGGSTLTWTPAAFGGSATAVKPVATGTTPNQIITLTLSDLIVIPSNTYTQIRTYYAGNASADNPAAGELAAFNAISGKVWKTGFSVGVVADNANMTLGTGQLIDPYSVLFYYDKPTITVAAVGGSTFRGQGSTANAYGFIYQACSSATTLDTKRIYSPYIAARSGSNSTTAAAQVSEIATKIKPQILLLLAGSGNDVDLTAVGFNAMKDRVKQGIETARSNLIRPVVATLAPANLSAGVEALRLAQNEWVRSLAPYVDVLDIARIVEDESNRAILKAIFNSGDDVHLNDAGHTAISSAFVRMLLNT